MKRAFCSQYQTTTVDMHQSTKVLPVSTSQLTRLRSSSVGEADECEALKGECNTGCPELLRSYSRDSSSQCHITDQLHATSPLANTPPRTE